MILTKTNSIDGTTNSMELPFTEEEFILKELHRENTGTLIQNEYPNLSADQREFIKTGITPAIWDRIFGNE